MYNLSAVGFEFHLLNWIDSTCTVGGMKPSHLRGELGVWGKFPLCRAT